MKKIRFILSVILILTCIISCTSVQTAKEADRIEKAVFKILGEIDSKSDPRVNSYSLASVSSTSDYDPPDAYHPRSYFIRIGFDPEKPKKECEIVLEEYKYRLLKVTNRMRVEPMRKWECIKLLSNSSESLAREKVTKTYNLIQKENKESLHFDYLEIHDAINVKDGGVEIVYTFYAPLNVDSKVVEYINSLL